MTSELSELRPGLLHWKAPHPGWTPQEGGPDGWEREVSSYAYVAGGTLVLLDPLEPPGELLAGRRLVVLLTVGSHARSAADLHAGGAEIYAPDPPRVGAFARGYRPGDFLPRGIQAKPGYHDDEALLWIPEHRALVVGDTLLGGGPAGVRIPEAWLPDGVSPRQFARPLLPLLDLPVELVLLTHGDPIVGGGRDALAAALRS